MKTATARASSEWLVVGGNASSKRKDEDTLGEGLTLSRCAGMREIQTRPSTSETFHSMTNARVFEEQ